MRVVDVVVSLVALVVLSPVLVIAAVAVRLTMGSPVLFRQVRAGRGGAPFELLKLRTMRDLRPGERSPDDDAARLTRLGEVLRRTSVDELPALVNVLRGELALVGPRPLPTKYVARYSPEQARRLEVRPGVTGWAQVHGRNTVPWDDRFRLDVWYVDHRSIALDLRILLKTVRTVLRREGISAEGHVTMREFTGD